MPAKKRWIGNEQWWLPTPRERNEKMGLGNGTWDAQVKVQGKAAN